MRSSFTKRPDTLIVIRPMNTQSIHSLVSLNMDLICVTVQNIAEKPNHITPANPYKEVKMDSLHDDVVDRAFRLDAMRRKI